MLKLNKSFRDFVTKGKRIWLLLFISFWSLNVVFFQIDWPFISCQLFILSTSIIAKRSYTFLLKIDFLTPFSFLQVINICFISFLIDAGKNNPRGVTLYKTFLYLFKAFKILSSSSSICIGFRPPAISKFCCPRTTIDSIGSYIGNFLFLLRWVIEKFCILLSFVFGIFPLIYVSWNLSSFLREFFSIRNFKKCPASKRCRLSLAFFPLK